jgi:2-polyprenyl-3-methyl-5-hydroxy-6-metoxy-1,4-benzoquinol methylase
MLAAFRKGGTAMAIDDAKLNAFMGQVVGDMGATMSAILLDIGDKLGLYRAMADSRPVTSVELAERTGTAERYVREWLSNQAAGGYVSYDAASGTFSLPPEQALALAAEGSPAFVPGAFQIIASLFRDEAKILEAFRTGEGVGWHEHDSELFIGTERFFRPSYNANLVNNWVPSLNGVDAKLLAGARVADVGCGLGASSIILAQAYPSSTFVGFDYHDRSIELARERAAEAGVGARVKFEVAAAKTYPGKDYDLVAFFDSLHDMGDPVGAAQHVRESLAADGTWLLVEPFANDRLEDNLNPVVAFTMAVRR